VTALSRLSTLEALAARDTPAARLDPRAKVLATLAYVSVVASFGRHDLLRLSPLSLFPLALAALGDVPLRSLGSRLALTSPFVLGVALFEPFLDRSPALRVGGLVLTGGAIGFATVATKFALSLSAALLLVATTGFDGVCAALRRLGVPRALVTQLLLTHRYLFVLSEEAGRSLRAHALRSPDRPRPTLRMAGTLLGQLLLRALARAERIHAAMRCRGFDGELRVARRWRASWRDAVFLTATAALLAASRALDVPGLVAGLGGLR
jgi:cobalt/nickel transport system permease protein